MGEIIAMNVRLIGVAVILCAGFGALYYGPWGFGALWAAQQPHRIMPDDYEKHATKVMIASIADSAFFTIMALLLYHAYGLGGVGLLAVSVTIGVYTNNSAKGGTNKMFAIDAGFLLCQLAMITAILVMMVRV